MSQKQQAYIRLLNMGNVYIRNILTKYRSSGILGFVRIDAEFIMAENVAQLIHSVPLRVPNSEIDDSDEWFIKNIANPFLETANKNHFIYAPLKEEIQKIAVMVEQ